MDVFRNVVSSLNFIRFPGIERNFHRINAGFFAVTRLWENSPVRLPTHARAPAENHRILPVTMGSGEEAVPFQQAGSGTLNTQKAYIGNAM